MSSEKNKTVTLILCIILGQLGAHRFYVGKIGTGFLWLFTLGLFGVGWLVDFLLIITDKFKDRHGYIVNLGMPVPEEHNTDNDKEKQEFLDFVNNYEVYILPSGKKYHDFNCPYIYLKNTITISRQQAILQGYEPCDKCRPFWKYNIMGV